MSDPAAIELIKAGKEIIAILTPAVLLWMAWWIRKLEKNTNSIKDELVEATKKGAYAAGVIQGNTKSTEQIAVAMVEEAATKAAKLLHEAAELAADKLRKASANGD